VREHGKRSEGFKTSQNEKRRRVRGEYSRKRRAEKENKAKRDLYRSGRGNRRGVSERVPPNKKCAQKGIREGLLGEKAKRRGKKLPEEVYQQNNPARLSLAL